MCNPFEESYIVEPLGQDNAAAMVDGDSGAAYFETLKDAIADAKGGETVTLLKNTTVTEGIAVNKAITLDLGSNTVSISADTSAISVVSGGDLEITGSGTISATGAGRPLQVIGNTNAGTWNDTNTTATLTINSSVTVTSNVQYDNCVYIAGKGAVLNVYGTLKGTNKCAAIQGNGTNNGTTNNGGTEINIYDGASVTSDSVAMYIPQAGEVNIYGGTVEGYAGIGIKSGDLNITGGIVRGVANDTVLTDEHSATNGIMYDGSAIVIDSYIGYAGQMDLNISDNATIESVYSTAIREIGKDIGMTNVVSIAISGGTVKSTLENIRVRDITKSTVSITGGTFSSEVDDSYLGENCECVKQSDGTYRVGVPVTVTFVNDGTTVKTDNVFAGDKVTAPSVSKVGYVLDGWYNGDTKYSFSSPVTSDLTLTAKWEAETYTVTFDANGGSAVEDVTVSYGGVVEEPTTTWEGYAFLGWYTEDGELYDFAAPVTGDLTLTAKWNEVVTPDDQPAGVDQIQVAPSIPVIDDNNAPAGSAEVVEALQGGVEQEGVTEAAKDLAFDSAYMAEIAAEAKTKLELGDDENVTLVVETSLNISVTDVKDGDSFTLDITPTYTITATADGKTTTIVEDEPLTVTKSVTLTIPLPKSFVDAAELFVHHLKNGRTYVYDGKVLNGKLSFLNPHGFSQFTISRTGPEASVDGVQYATLQEAVDAVENRGTITVHQSGLYAQVSGVKTFWVETDTGVEMPLLYAAPGYTLSKDGNKYTVRVRTIDDPDNDYTLPTWDIIVEDSDNGDVEVSPEEAKPTTTITITATPDKGYEVAEVVVTAENGKEITVTDKGNGKYTFSMPNSDVTIEVTFQPVSGGAAGSDLTITAPTGWVNPFTDVAANAWYYDAVGYANANGLMGGTSATTFAPNGAMNRSMVWTVIARLAGQTISGANWAEDAKAWAVAQGVSDGTNPDGNVTREELVTMLYRYIGSPVMNVPELGLINGYPDAASVSDWAQNAFAWALSRGIIDGRDGKLASGESVTRAEAATILARFHLLTK